MCLHGLSLRRGRGGGGGEYGFGYVCVWGERERRDFSLHIKTPVILD